MTKDVEIEQVKKLLIEYNGDRAKVAEALNVNKNTIANWINRRFELRQFRIRPRPKVITKAPPNCQVTKTILETQLNKIRQGSEYRNADAKGRAEIEARIRLLYI